MSKHLPAELKLRILERIKSGENISAISKELKISRTIIYKWASMYKKAGPRGKVSVLKPKTVKPKAHWKSLNEETRRNILNLAVKNPDYSIRDIARSLKISIKGIWKTLKSHNLTTKEERRRYIQIYGNSLIKTASKEEKLAMIRRFEEGESVTRLCQQFNISRTTFYKWYKRYKNSTEDNKKEALSNLRPKGISHWKFIQGEYEEAILSAVRQYPELSSHKLVWALPQVGGTPIASNKGIHNVLKRHNLNTYDARLAYSKAYYKPTIQSAIFAAFRSVLSFIGSRSDIQRNIFVKSGFGVGLGVFGLVIIFGLISLSRFIFSASSIVFSIGLIFSLTALTFGMFFFIYSLKYYLTIAIVLSYSRNYQSFDSTQGRDKKGKLLGDRLNGRLGGRSIISKLFHNATYHSFDSTQDRPFNSVQGKAYRYQYHGGLKIDLSDVVLDRHPFVSIHLATYNEKKVIERLLTAATSQEYDNFEVVLTDDSTDETVQILEKWKEHPKVKIIHRDSRAGFKGGALSYALKECDVRTEFVIILDADFIPYPDTITQFLKQFKHSLGSLDKDVIKQSNLGAVQGYQWHVLNKSENWITRGVRTEYSGSYVIERSGAEVYGGLKQIAGSVYMIRRDILQACGWGTSITEDFELTLKLYQRGYKVAFTPYIQAPSECVSTIKRLIRQRMRWAEGHSNNIKKMFIPLITSPYLTLMEKIELIYLAPYYLQAAFFIAGTMSWFLAEVVFGVTLPFWTSTWGWSLVFTNLFALPLLNIVGLFLEESDEKDYLGIFSFLALSYIVAPFQGYAAIKGFLEREEGPWFRTPKTGKITDVFIPGRFYRFVTGIFGKTPSGSQAVASVTPSGYVPAVLGQYVKLVTANNTFENFSIIPKKKKWVGNLVVLFIIILTAISPLLIPWASKNRTVHAQQLPQNKTVVVSIPKAITYITSEQVGGSDAHTVILSFPNQTPSYKYQFLTGGMRLFIDRKDGQGWVQLISQIQTAPEYMKQQGAAGNFVWRSYGLNINTTGANVLQGFDRQDQADGSIKFIKTYTTAEEGIAEALTETWIIPKEAEDLASRGPKVTYSMTKNRGIILTKGVQEGTWRMRWALSGIADITADNLDIKDENGWPLIKKSYLNNSFTIDVQDFDNVQNDPNAFSFSEIATNNKAEILFFKNGTTSDRLVDPATTVTTVASAWPNNQMRNVYYDGTNFFVFYDKGSTSIFARGAGTIAGLSDGGGASEQTVVNGGLCAGKGWDVGLITDSKFDIVYATSTCGTGGNFKVVTCTTSGTTISCTGASAAGTVGNAQGYTHVVRTTTGDRIWVTADDDLIEADQTGDGSGVSSWTTKASGLNIQQGTGLIAYESSDKVLSVEMRNGAGTKDDGVFYTACAHGAACSYSLAITEDNSGTARDGNAIRITDTDFRYVYVDLSATNQVIEAKFNGSSTWTTTTTVDTAGSQNDPAIFYDRVGDTAYAFYTDTAATPDTIQRYVKTTASTYSNSWGSKTDVGGGAGSNNDSLAVTQAHEPPYQASRTTPRELTWCYKRVNSTNFDVQCDNLNLAVIPENPIILFGLSPILGYLIMNMRKRKVFKITLNC